MRENNLDGTAVIFQPSSNTRFDDLPDSEPTNNSKFSLAYCYNKSDHNVCKNNFFGFHKLTSEQQIERCNRLIDVRRFVEIMENHKRVYNEETTTSKDVSFPEFAKLEYLTNYHQNEVSQLVKDYFCEQDLESSVNSKCIQCTIKDRVEQAKRVLTAKWSEQCVVSFMEEAYRYRTQNHLDIPPSPEFELFLKMRADQSSGHFESTPTEQIKAYEEVEMEMCPFSRDAIDAVYRENLKDRFGYPINIYKEISDYQNDGQNGSKPSIFVNRIFRDGKALFPCKEVCPAGLTESMIKKADEEKRNRLKPFESCIENCKENVECPCHLANISSSLSNVDLLKRLLGFGPNDLVAQLYFDKTYNSSLSGYAKDAEVYMFIEKFDFSKLKNWRIRQSTTYNEAKSLLDSQSIFVTTAKRRQISLEKLEYTSLQKELDNEGAKSWEEPKTKKSKNESTLQKT